MVVSHINKKDIHESVSIMYKDLEEIVTSRLKSLMKAMPLLKILFLVLI